MKIRLPRWKKDNPNSDRIISFTGGLGAQIFSYSIYYALKDDPKIFGDLSYFKIPTKIAEENTAELSHWDWELSKYGVQKSSIRQKYTASKQDIHYTDHYKKHETAINLLHTNKEIFTNFLPIPIDIQNKCLQITNNEYICAHLRRGDYLNVAELVYSEEEFIQTLKKTKNFLKEIIIISDSRPSEQFETFISEAYQNHRFIIGGDLHVAHALMRQAKILICSNSQFSLSAALLNKEDGLIFAPTKWHPNRWEYIDNICGFQIIR
jgi:hypothetical protein